MRSEIDIALEVSPQVATLRLAGPIHQADVDAVGRVCLMLPTTVTTLHIDARHLTALNGHAAAALRSLIVQWRSVRRGHVEIGADPPALELLADRVNLSPRPHTFVESSSPPADAALTGTFL